MKTITTIGLDIAKSVFQVHGTDADGNVVVRRQLKRRYVLAFFQKLPSCLVGIEACASSHHWFRLSLQHDRRSRRKRACDDYACEGLARRLSGESRLGVNEALLVLGHGIKRQMLVALIRAELAETKRGVVKAGCKSVEVSRIRIAAAGRETIEG